MEGTREGKEGRRGTARMMTGPSRAHGPWGNEVPRTLEHRHFPFLQLLGNLQLVHPQRENKPERPGLPIGLFWRINCMESSPTLPERTVHILGHISHLSMEETDCIQSKPGTDSSLLVVSLGHLRLFSGLRRLKEAIICWPDWCFQSGLRNTVSRIWLPLEVKNALTNITDAEKPCSKSNIMIYNKGKSYFSEREQNNQLPIFNPKAHLDIVSVAYSLEV